MSRSVIGEGNHGRRDEGLGYVSPLLDGRHGVEFVSKSFASEWV